MADEELEHFSKSSMMGWMMTANTCAPFRPKDGRHLATQVADIINPPGPSHYESTNAATFRGWEGSQLKNAKLPQKLKYQDPQTFVEEGTDPNRYQSSSRQFFRDPKQGKPVLLTRRSNDPSEADHPMLGLQNPKRAEMLANSGAHYNSTSRASYTQQTYVYEGMRCACGLTNMLPRCSQPPPPSARALAHLRLPASMPQENRPVLALVGHRLEPGLEDEGPADGEPGALHQLPGQRLHRPGQVDEDLRVGVFVAVI